MHDLIDYLFGAFIVCICIIMLVGAWALFVEVKKDVSISEDNNAHSVNVYKIN